MQIAHTVAIAKKVKHEYQRHRHLGQRTAEDHHRTSQKRDAERHEQHVAELVDREVDSGKQRYLPVPIVKRMP